MSSESHFLVSFFKMVPLMIMDVLGHIPGIPGLFLATVYCASLRYVRDVSLRLANSPNEF